MYKLEGPLLPLAFGGLVFYLVKKYTDSNPLALTASVGIFALTMVGIDNYLDARHSKKLKP